MRRARFKPKSKVWLEIDGVYLMGDGRAELLSAVDRAGSISEAARELGISYRQAWGYIKKLEGRSQMKIVETQRGGVGGGAARLTKRGRDFLLKYLAFRAGINDVIDEKFARHFGKR
ncbi:MAG: LysR family transcriptional regulator [Planctomycetes bacterium]|nr:LysR family transcriptional regulator [Planctomycetota bacterium]